MKPIDFLDGANAAYIDEMYSRWLRDPASVDEMWGAFFAGFEAGWRRPPPPGKKGAGEVAEAAAAVSPPAQGGSKGAFGLVNAYREFGHLVAKLDPLGDNLEGHPYLDLEAYGFDDSDLDKTVGEGGFLGPPARTLRELREALQRTYCGTLSVQCADIPNETMRRWFYERVEPCLAQPDFDERERVTILTRLCEAEGFEQFLQTKYLGKKRFSIEGGEALIPMLESLVEDAADMGVDELILGMAHRGRLNVLTHIMEKPYEDMLGEFEGHPPDPTIVGDGDVKYHMGYSTDRVTRNGNKIHLSLSPNPSHLELVDPVIEGVVRAKQEYLKDLRRTRVIPVMIHGDAAVMGQGVVPETLVLSELDDYTTGGTIHIVVNNQIGFTAEPRESRFTPHPTDIGRVIQAPVFHVNADDPDACVWAMKKALQFRQRFRVDVMINLVCYRRYGHNEGDDPSFTQPLLYKRVDAHPSVTALYSKRLIADGVLDEAEYEGIQEQIRDRLESALENARKEDALITMTAFGGVWAGLTRAGKDWSAKTAVKPEVLERLGKKLVEVPSGFNTHRKLERILLKTRAEMYRGEKPLDWGAAEALAYATLLAEGFPIRLAGQDAARGTFSHRHAVMKDTETGGIHIPLQHLTRDQGEFTVINTMLSELAVLGFEYGMSWADPRRLFIWEAQFGDFANGAQTIIDQFICSAETKWQRMSGLVMLLPHGYEGQGPEHSSARLERYLQLSGEDNWQITHPTTPAQFFHLLRRQMLRRFRKPLVVLSPKVLLRLGEATSPLEDLSKGSFHDVLDDPGAPEPEAVRKVAFCSGKIYYTLAEARQERGIDDVAVVRVEQLYPFPAREIEERLSRYSAAEEFWWVQEEPVNMGAWSFVEPRLRELLGDRGPVRYAGRDEASSPATGSARAHAREEAWILDEFLGEGAASGEGASGEREAAG